MNTRFACGLITFLGVLALQPTADASFHFMQIEQVIGSVNGDTTVQAIQLRMRSPGENLVSQGKLVVFDAAGLNPITVVDPTSNVPNGATGDHVLIASANFASHTTPPAMPDFIMANPIPASYFAAGSLCWQNNSGTITYWRLSWGGASYTGSCTGSTLNDMDGNFCPPFGSPLPSSGITAVQFQGPATAFSTNNAADYLLTTGPVVFINNAGTSFTVTGVLPTVTITAPDPNASEVPSTDVGRFRVTRTGNTTSDLRVFYTIGGTATNSVDYQRLRNNATIRSGRTFVAITLRPIDDTISEPDETAVLTLSPNPNYIIGSPNTATVTVHSNE